MDDPRAARLREVFDRMRAEGRSHAEIMAFADKARSAIAQQDDARRAQLKEKAAGYGRAAAAAEAESISLGDEILKAGSSLTGDLVDTMSLGAYRPVRNAIGGLVAPEATAQLQRDEAEIQGAEGYGLASGVVRGAGMGMGAPAKIAEGAAHILPSVTSRLARAAIAGGTVGGLSAAGESASAGAPLDETAANAALGAAVGAGTSAAFALPGEVGRAAKAKLTDRRTHMGRIVTDYRRGVESGRYETPEFKAEATGREGINEAADEAARAITDANVGDLAAARQEYRSGLGGIVSKHGQKQIDVSGVHGALDSLTAENTVNGVTADQGLQGAIEKVRSMTSKPSVVTAQGKRVPLPANVTPEAAAEMAEQLGGRVESEPVSTVGELLKTKKVVQDLAEFGKPVTPDNRPYRVVYGKLAEAAEQAVPEVGPLNKRFATTLSNLERANAILYGQETPEVQQRPAAERAAASRLGRVGDDTQAATGASARQIAELRAMDPRYAQQIENVELKKAHVGTRFGAPHLSTHIERAALSGLIHNATAAGARVGFPVADIASRLSMDPELVSRMSTNPIMAAYLVDRARQRDLASKLLSGGRR